MRLNSQGFCDHCIPLATLKQALVAILSLIFYRQTEICKNLTLLKFGRYHHYRHSIDANDRSNLCHVRNPRQQGSVINEGGIHADLYFC